MKKLLLLFSLMLCFILIGANLLAQAANDNLCNAISIEIDEACNEAKQIDLVGATIETGEEIISPSCTDGDTVLTSTVWFSFVAPADEIYILAEADDKSISALAYQMQLFSLNGDCADIGNLELVNCNTPITNLLESPAILTTLSAGETYYVQISGRSFPDLGPFESTGCLTISTVTAPENDDVCNATALEIDAEAQVFSNLGASAEDGEATIAPPPSSDPFGFEAGGWAVTTNVIDHSVWFTFTTPDEGGNYTVDLTSSLALAGNFNTQVAVYEATNCNDFSTFNLLGAGDNKFPDNFPGAIEVSPRLDVFCLERNTTYYILVDGGTSFFFQPIPFQGMFSIQVNTLITEDLSANTYVQAPFCEGDESGTAISLGVGGAGEFTYQWSTGANTPEILYELEAGDYTVTITDQCGVEVVETLEIPANSQPALSIAVDGLEACEGEEVTLSASASGGLPFDPPRLYTKTSFSLNLGELINPVFKDELIPISGFSDPLSQINDMTALGDDLYGVGGSNSMLYKVNVENGEVNLIDTLGIGFVSDITYVNTTDKLYAIVNEIGAVYEIDPENGDTTLVFNPELESVRQAAIDENEVVYYLTFDGTLFKMPLSTASVQNFGSIEQDRFGISDLEIDPWDNSLYFTRRYTLNENTSLGWQGIHKVDTNTGEIIEIYEEPLANLIFTFAFKQRPADEPPYIFEWQANEAFEDPFADTQTLLASENTTFAVTVFDACDEPLQEEFSLVIFPTEEVTIDTSILKGETYDGIVIEADTTIMETFTTEDGCEGTLIVNVMVVISGTQQTWANNAIQISPNPTRSILNVNTLGIEERVVEFRILDVHGRVLWQQSRQHLQEEIEVSEFRSGLYFLEIRTAEKVAVRQFVKM